MAEQVEEVLAAISGQLEKRRILKDCVTIYAKGIGYQEHHTT